MNNTGPGNGYTVFLPQELAPGGAKNPIVGWMSGGSTDPSLYTLLPHLASHGFVVVASNTVPAIGAEVALGAGDHRRHRLDPRAERATRAARSSRSSTRSKVASMGYSMGALATTTIATIRG